MDVFRYFFVNSVNIKIKMIFTYIFFQKYVILLYLVIIL